MRCFRHGLRALVIDGCHRVLTLGPETMALNNYTYDTAESCTWPYETLRASKPESKWLFCVSLRGPRVCVGAPCHRVAEYKNNATW